MNSLRMSRAILVMFALNFSLTALGLEFESLDINIHRSNNGSRAEYYFGNTSLLPATEEAADELSKLARGRYRCEVKKSPFGLNGSTSESGGGIGFVRISALAIYAARNCKSI